MSSKCHCIMSLLTRLTDHLLTPDKTADIVIITLNAAIQSPSSCAEQPDVAVNNVFMDVKNILLSIQRQNEEIMESLTFDGSLILKLN